MNSSFNVSSANHSAPPENILDMPPIDCRLSAVDAWAIMVAVQRAYQQSSESDTISILSRIAVLGLQTRLQEIFPQMAQLGMQWKRNEAN